MLLSTGPHASWKPSGQIDVFVSTVVGPAIDAAGLAAGTRSPYLSALDLLMGKCARKDHTHKASLRGKAIHEASKFTVLEKCLVEIAALHGDGTAKHAKAVLSKYVLGQLVRAGAIDHNPLYGVQLSLENPDSRTGRGGVGLDLDQWRAVLDYLLALDTADGVGSPKRGRYSRADRVAVTTNAADLTLLQATTGLRIDEALGLTWADMDQIKADQVKRGRLKADDDTLYVPVWEGRAKTGRARAFPVAVEPVAQRLRERRANAPSLESPVIGAPADPSKSWDSSNASKAVRKLYIQMAEQLSIGDLFVQRSHVWRATLNGLVISENVPVEIRAAWFGHSPDVNQSAYTDIHDPAPMADALSRLYTR
jgi:integrase